MSEPHKIVDERLVLLETLLEVLGNQSDAISRFCNLHSEFFQAGDYSYCRQIYDQAKELSTHIDRELYGRRNDR